MANDEQTVNKQLIACGQMTSDSRPMASTGRPVVKLFNFNHKLPNNMNRSFSVANAGQSGRSEGHQQNCLSDNNQQQVYI